MSNKASLIIGGKERWATKTGSLLGHYIDVNTDFFPRESTFTGVSGRTYTDKNSIVQSAGLNIPRVDYSENSDGELLLETGEVLYNFGSVNDFNSSEGVLYFKGTKATLSEGTISVFADNGNYLHLDFQDDRIQTRFYNNSVVSASAVKTIYPFDEMEILVTWSNITGYLKLYINNTLVATSAQTNSIGSANPWSSLKFSNRYGYVTPYYGRVREIKIYKSLQDAIDDGYTYIDD